jgi:hypothetical protein
VDLLADNTPVLNLAVNKFEYGVSIIGFTMLKIVTEEEVYYLNDKQSLNHVFNEIV